MNGTTGPQTTVVSFGASETNLVYGMAFPAGTFGSVPLLFRDLVLSSSRSTVREFTVLITGT